MSIRLHVMIKPETDSRLRSRAMKHGDLGRMVDEAITAYLDKLDKEEVTE